MEDVVFDFVDRTFEEDQILLFCDLPVFDELPQIIELVLPHAHLDEEVDAVDVENPLYGILVSLFSEVLIFRRVNCAGESAAYG